MGVLGQVFASVKPVFVPGSRVRHNQYELGTGPGGGDGMNFPSANDSYYFYPNSVPANEKPKAILSAWVDLTSVTGTGYFWITVGGRVIPIAMGQSGYITLALLNANQKILFTSGIAGLCYVTLYDFNAQFLGAPSAGPASSGVAGPSGLSGNGGLVP